MDPSCLKYRLTKSERQAFERDGFLIVEGALDPERVEKLIEVVDRLHGEGKLSARGDTGIQQRTNTLNFAGMDPKFIDMVDYPRTFPKVWGALGWNIYLYHSHLAVSFPTEGKFESDRDTFRWHQDSGRLNGEMETDPAPRLSLKIGYFLTDLTRSGGGNFWVIPGSHLKKRIQLPAGGRGQPDGAMPVLVAPGAAVIFDRRIWHAATPNHSSITRKVLFYGYGYRWIRTRDEMTIPRDYYEAADPVRKQILGHSHNGEHGRSSPTDDDVPLRVWLREHDPAAAAD